MMGNSLSGHEKTLRLVETSVLLTLTVVLTFFSLKIGPTLEITLASLPVMIGAVLLGPKVGLLLGTAFGISSFLMCFGISPFGNLLLNENPYFAFLVCVPTRMLMGLLTGLVSRWLIGKRRLLCADIVSAAAAPILNTFFFMGLLILLYYNGEALQGMATANGIISVFGMIVFLAGLNAVIEAIVCSVAGFSLLLALRQALKR